MKQSVTIHESDSTKTLATCDKSACQGCQSSAFCSGKRAEVFEVIRPDSITVNKGDRVTIEMNEGRTIISVIISLLVPLLCFIPGYFVGRAISSSEIVMLSFGLLAVLIGFVLVGAYFKLFKRHYTPTIVSVDKKEEI